MNFYEYMGMKEVVIGPDGVPMQVQATGRAFDVKEVCTATVLGAALALSTGAAIHPTNIAASTSHRKQTAERQLTVAARIAFCRAQLSLNMTQMASVLKRERQTLYAWIAASSLPQPHGEQRLDKIVKLASEWQRHSPEPMGRASMRTLSNGQNLYQMLCADMIDPFQIRPLFPELKQLASAKSSGETRRQRWIATGYEDLSDQQMDERLQANLAI